MYARKRRRRGGSRGQARDLLVQVMAERDGLDARRGVAELAAAVGRRLGLDAEELDVLIRAAELHDVGKVAVPDDDPRTRPGRSTASEWAIMRQHTVAGERILGRGRAHAPGRAARARRPRALGRRAAIPDGLRGEEIPLGARIICACEAYDAMVRGAPYREPLSPRRRSRAAPVRRDPVRSHWSWNRRGGWRPQTLTQLCQGSATLALSGRADDPRGG